MAPTSTILAPDWRMTSGMRKLPPISTSWPRLTIASLREASPAIDEQHRGGVVVDRHRGLGAGESQMSRSTWAWRLPRSPLSTSYSSVE